MNKAERAYISSAVEHGCVLCRKICGLNTPAEYHHKRTGTGAGRRASHYHGFALCPYHHRSSNEALHVMGRKAFERHFGVTEAQLVEQTRETLKHLIPEGA